MKSRVMMGICLTLFLTSVLVSTLKIGAVSSQAVELSYDDGEADAGVSNLANKTYGWGVSFDHPETGKKYQVQSIKIYIYMIKGTEEGLLRIFIYLYKPSITKYEKLLETVLGGFSQGWNMIDLTPYNIVVDQNFIIGVNWARDYILHVGDDHDTSCHSGGFNTTDLTDFEHYSERNFMIRAYVKPVITATIDIDPDTLNLKSKGKWITCHIELPESYNVSDIDVSTITLNETVPAELYPIEVEDYDQDGIPDLMVKFDRAKVIQFILSNLKYPAFERVFPSLVIEAKLTVTGQLCDGTLFEGTNTIRVILFQKGHPIPF